MSKQSAFRFLEAWAPEPPGLSLLGLVSDMTAKVFPPGLLRVQPLCRLDVPTTQGHLARGEDGARFVGDPQAAFPVCPPHHVQIFLKCPGGSTSAC